jgi:hypothetical protein
MSRVRLFHWKAAEAAPLADVLRAAGYAVDYQEKVDPGLFRAMRQSLPDAFVIDLSRLPSHGREVATFIRGHKTLRQVPIVFADGAPDKVAAIRALLPDAAYASSAKLRSALREALAHRPAAPVVPAQMMERYAARTTAQKLGIREDSTVAVIDPPGNYATAIGELPSGARLDESPAAPSDVTLWFVRDPAACQQALPRMRKLAARTKLWILWQKGGAVTQPYLRQSAAQVGLVDYKICSVNHAWSGMLFAPRKGV